MKYIIGIDIGTTAPKGVLYDTKGKNVSKYAIPYPLIQQENGKQKKTHR